jgi:septal ring factor EnvC (AmiA/AmiB activator)
MLEESAPAPSGGPMKWIIGALAAIFVFGSSYFLHDTREHAEQLDTWQKTTNTQIADLTKRLSEAEANSETLASQLGMTKKELEQKSADLQSQARAAEAHIQQTKAEVTKVSGEVTSVQGDVGGVKTDVASTKTDLEATKAKLEHAIGDLGVQSGLIAHTRDDLESLKHKGDRNYYEFTLVKGAAASPLSTVALQLKKVDPKKGKYTMNVTADDHVIEKKDRNMNEPIQFYSGRDHMLFELVVWTVDKNKVTGYLSTPKGAPVPVTASNPQ